LGQEVYPYIPVKFISKFNYQTAEYLKKFKSPVLIIHSPYDDIVPFHHGEELFKAANSSKEFLKIFGAHNDGFLTSKAVYINGLKDFLYGIN